MAIIRKYGRDPFTICVIHGGPGAPGSVASLARGLSREFGVLEPLQSVRSIDGLLTELNGQIGAHAKAPVTLIGHSWGAWLSYMFTSRFPGTVSKLILVGSGPFTSAGAQELWQTRLSRLTPEEREEYEGLLDLLALPSPTGMEHMGRLEQITIKTDSFSPAVNEKDKSDSLPPDPGSFRAIWREAEHLRRTGGLLRYGSSIKCPVIALHGDYDPHPAAGVREPLGQVIDDFRFFLLERCGHYPWLEQHAREHFFALLRKELGA